MYIPMWSFWLFVAVMVAVEIYEGHKHRNPATGTNDALFFYRLLVGLLLIVGLPILFIVGSIWWTYKTVPGASFPIGPSIFLAIVIGFFWWLSKRA